MDDTGVVLTGHKLDVDDYHRMADAGILGEDERVELIDGELIDMALVGQDHTAPVNGLNLALVIAPAATGRSAGPGPPRRSAHPVHPAEPNHHRAHARSWCDHATLTPAPAAEIWLCVHRENRRAPRVRTVLDCIADAVRNRTAALNPVEPADTPV